jgi:acyl carrier protein
VEEKLIAEMADILDVEPGSLTLDTRFKDDEFNFDSLTGYAVVVMLEDEFGLAIGVDAFTAAQTIRDLYDQIPGARP